MSAALIAVLGALSVLQGTAPLRKTDLVRLLSGSVMSPTELAQLVRRNCLTFAPTDRDRNDFRMLGADPAVLAAMDGCARRKAPARPAASRRAVPPSAPPVVIQVQRIIVRVSPERSGFVSGGGQRGTVGPSCRGR